MRRASEAGGRKRPLIVGIVNATPDSFYDGGRYAPADHGRALLGEGADWIDVGGESTRPGAAPVGESEELQRVIPVIEALAGAAPISIDTTRPAVARAAAEAGATILNDVRGLQDDGMVEVSCLFSATIVMHSRGTPQSMGHLTQYGDVVAEVRDWLVAAAQRARSPEVWIDPGIGFAKTPAQSLALLGRLDVLVESGYPVLVGASRKSFIGRTLDLGDPDDRLYGSLAAAAAAWRRGAGALRVHDVRATRELIAMLDAIESAG